MPSVVNKHTKGLWSLLIKHSLPHTNTLKCSRAQKYAKVSLSMVEYFSCAGISALEACVMMHSLPDLDLCASTAPRPFKLVSVVMMNVSEGSKPKRAVATQIAF